MPTPDQLRLLIIILPAILFVMGFRRPIFAVAAYMIIVYCKASYYYPTLAAMKVELIFALLILLMLILKKNFAIRLSPRSDSINRALYWFIASVAVSFVVSWNKQYSWDNAVYHFIKTVFLYMMIVAGIEDYKDLKFFVWAFVGMFCYLAYEPAYYFLSGIGGSNQMYGINYIADVGILAGHVALANNMNQMIPIAFFLALGSMKKYAQIAASCCLTFFVISLVGSGSRGGVVGLAVSGCCIVLFSSKRIKTALIVSLIIIVMGASIGSRFMYTASRIDGAQTHGRLTGITHGLGMIMKGNIIGVGPGCYLFARGKYFSHTMESHNIYGQILGDLGIPGMIFWGLFVMKLFENIKNLKSILIEKNQKMEFFYYLMLGLQVSLITRLVISFASHGLYYFYWYVVAAIIVSAKRIIYAEMEFSK